MKIVKKGRCEMYTFRQDVNIDFRDRKLASEQIGVNYNTLGMIMRGKLSCSKTLAYCITKFLFEEAEIDDFFERVREESKDEIESTTSIE